MNEMQLSVLHKASCNNKVVLKASRICGCFYCERLYSPSDIVEWVDRRGDTALCPRCGIDSVLPLDDDSNNLVILQEMRELWFDRTVTAREVESWKS